MINTRAMGGRLKHQNNMPAMGAFSYALRLGATMATGLRGNRFTYERTAEIVGRCCLLDGFQGGRGMINLSLRYLALIAVVAGGFATGLGMKTASAADLGGDCCADLEERVAELEATTVRKGNKKVSVTLTGWVAEQVVYWDDGVEQNTYVTGLGTAFASNFHITGEAQIAPGWKSGYTIWVEADGSDVYTTNQFNDNGVMAISGIRGLQVLKSFWFLESERLGKVSLGLNHPADDSAVVALDNSGTLVAAYWVAYDVFSFYVRGNFPGTNKGLPNGSANSTTMIWGNSVSCRGYGGGPGDCNACRSTWCVMTHPCGTASRVSSPRGEERQRRLCSVLQERLGQPESVCGRHLFRDDGQRPGRTKEWRP